MDSVFDRNRQQADADCKIAAALERIAQSFRVMLWNENRRHELSPIQMQFLVFLLYHPRPHCTVGNLAREFDLTPPTVSDAIRVLEEKRLLARESNPQDRRRFEFVLTAKGRKVAEDAAGYANELQRISAAMDRATKSTLLRGLMEIIDGLQKSGHITVARMCLTCRFFDHKPDTTKPYFCRLLEKPLAESELRVDCPEHQDRVATV